MKLKLVVLSEGKGKGKAIPITLPQFIVGRDKQCHLRPVSPLISKRHCAFIVKDEKAYIRDFDSTNGTLVNEKPIKGQQELKHSDILKIGPLHFQVEIEETVSVDKPTPPPGKSLADLSDDDSIAALLMDDEGGTVQLDDSVEDHLGDGTTMMEMAMSPELAASIENQAEKKEDDDEGKKKDPKGTSSSAAAEILQQMYRRR